MRAATTFRSSGATTAVWIALVSPFQALLRGSPNRSCSLPWRRGTSGLIGGRQATSWFGQGAAAGWDGPDRRLFLDATIYANPSLCRGPWWFAGWEVVGRATVRRWPPWAIPSFDARRSPSSARALRRVGSRQASRGEGTPRRLPSRAGSCWALRLRDRRPSACATCGSRGGSESRRQVRRCRARAEDQTWDHSGARRPPHCALLPTDVVANLARGHGRGAGPPGGHGNGRARPPTPIQPARTTHRCQPVSAGARARPRRPRASARSSSSVRSWIGCGDEHAPRPPAGRAPGLVVGGLHELARGDEHRRAPCASRSSSTSCRPHDMQEPQSASASITASQRCGDLVAQVDRRGLREGRLGRAQRPRAPRARSSALELVEEHVAARLADVEQPDRRRQPRRRGASGRPARRRARAVGSRIGQRHGDTRSRVTGSRPISPPTQPPMTIENSPASPPAWASRMRSGAANFGTGISGSLDPLGSMPSAMPPAPRTSSPAGACVSSSSALLQRCARSQPASREHAAVLGPDDEHRVERQPQLAECATDSSASRQRRAQRPRARARAGRRRRAAPPAP